ncbi:MAG: hypothetical protein HAW66_08185 [Shewanella sp.]|nr:hypothetical protein [Shewanella sp.]
MGIAIDSTLTLLPESITKLNEIKEAPHSVNGTDVEFHCHSKILGNISYQVRFMEGKATQVVTNRDKLNRQFTELNDQHPLVVFINDQIELYDWDVIEKPDPEPAKFASPQVDLSESFINGQL